MGRPRKTDRHDDFEPPSEEADRDEDRDQFENPMFSDSVESPFHVAREDWPPNTAMRWISIEVTGSPDNRNWSLKTAAHWVPVRRGKYPHIDKKLPHVPMPGIGSGGDGELIVFGGLCLCERDIRYNQRDAKMQERATQEAGRTVETYVEGGNSNFPRFNQSQPVQFERGVRPAQFKE